MRSIWHGLVSVGIISIPVRLYAATERRTVAFRQIHTADGGRIRHRKVCELDGHEVEPHELGRGYEVTPREVIPLTEEDLDALPLPTAQTIGLLAFVPADTIDPLQIDRSYYVGADGRPAAKPYVLLREALQRRGAVAMAKVALRGRESLAVLRAYGETLLLQTLLWPDEIRAPTGIAPRGDVPIREDELRLADTLMDALGDLAAEDLTDHYREAVETLVAAKLEGNPPQKPATPAPVVDLMAALEESIRATRAARGESQDSSTTHETGSRPAL